MDPVRTVFTWPNTTGRYPCRRSPQPPTVLVVTPDRGLAELIACAKQLPAALFGRLDGPVGEPAFVTLPVHRAEPTVLPVATTGADGADGADSHRA